MISKAPIALDYTLHDQYALENEGKPLPVLFFYPSRFKNHDVSPVKFTYHAGLQAGETSIHASKAMALSVKTVPQRYSFSAGQMRLIILDFDSPEHEQGTLAPLTGQLEMCETFTQLRHDQQPIVSFTANPNHIELDPGTSIAVVLPTDCVSHVPHLINPEMHYEILSKRGLAHSGLPTPPSIVIDSLLHSHHIHDPTQIQQEILRMTEPLDTYRVPFMLKLPQSISGKGVFRVSSNADRGRVKAMLGARLREMLVQINAANQHLHPCSLVLQDYIPGAVVALSLFVTQKGRPIFVACCEQRFDEQGHWVGGSISYPDQAVMHQKFAGTMEKTARFLHQRGYYGPAGVDIVTTEEGEQYIIDLNARVTGTYYLGPLAGHFMQRGLAKATMLTEYFLCSRSSFEEAFESEIQDGSLIIASWTRDESIRLSHGTITIGGRDASEMESLVEKIEAHTCVYASS